MANANKTAGGTTSFSSNVSAKVIRGNGTTQEIVAEVPRTTLVHRVVKFLLLKGSR